ncbi:GGDEF domain-containing response regulator [Aromatoleum anaerobium]|uniref:diguanylate cyclase n=1 Tax=Aromatoleum anaerobium TaxID=182180 RepID=A0ABX1PJA6_9RHOO|nr:diguanylate cyclase [Aromatoleum anaerobium]MCK0506626.1 diguanylate cyclase [Aromatoleum anaerobium]
MNSALPRVLIVDDERSNINILGNLLAPDYEVVVAIDGASALRRARAATPPDIILLDVMMPDMNGYDVCRLLKADAATRDIPVIFITSMGEEDNEAYGLDIGAVDYVAKPFSPAILKRRIQTHVELKRLRDHYQHLSATDPLTGIANRRRFDEAYAAAWQSALRRHEPLALIMLDVDRFKAYNDHYGHPAGDRCLQRVARALHGSLVRADDLLARYGGEEFVCLLPATDLAGGEAVARRLHRAVRELDLPHEHPEVAGRVSISVGVAVAWPAAGGEPERLVAEADLRLYEAKAGGRDRIVAGGAVSDGSGQA